MNHYAFPLNASPAEQAYTHWRGAFTSDDLKRVVALGDSLPAEDAKVGNSAEGVVNQDIRTCKLAWINASDENAWLFEKMGGVVRELNRDYYHYDLWGFESFQYTIYDGTAHGEYYDWHIDTIGKGNQQQRKLSVVLQLSDPQDYEGGELWLHGATKMCVPKERGLIYAFPSYTLHRVTPVTAGVRKTLVGWIVGPQFK